MHPILGAYEQRQCEGQISITEATEALSCLKNGSAPGSDGLPAEFYTCFLLILFF